MTAEPMLTAGFSGCKHAAALSRQLPSVDFYPVQILADALPGGQQGRGQGSPPTQGWGGAGSRETPPADRLSFPDCGPDAPIFCTVLTCRFTKGETAVRPPGALYLIPGVGIAYP
jgi:hypothetical protein